MTTEPKARPRPKPRNPDRARPKTEAWRAYDPDDDELPGTSPKPPTEKARWLRAIESLTPKVGDTDKIIIFDEWTDRSDGRIPACACLAQAGLAINAQNVERIKYLAIASAFLKQNGFAISLNE